MRGKGGFSQAHRRILPPPHTHTWQSLLFLPAYPPSHPPNTHTQADTDMVFAFFCQHALLFYVPHYSHGLHSSFFYCSHQIIRMAHMMRFTRSLLLVTVYIRLSECSTWSLFFHSHQIIRMLHMVFVFDQSIHIGSSDAPHGLWVPFTKLFTSDHQNAPNDETHVVFDFVLTVHIRSSEWLTWWDSRGLCFCFDSSH